MNIENTLHEIIGNGTAGVVKGKIVDTFTANMILTVATKLNEENRKKLYELPIHKMVALSYKMLTQ